MNLANSLKHSSEQVWPSNLGLLNDVQGGCLLTFETAPPVKKKAETTFVQPTLPLPIFILFIYLLDFFL